MLLLAIRAGTDLDDAVRRAAAFPALSMRPVRAYRHPATGSGLLWIRLAAPGAREVEAVRALADGNRVSIVEADRWSRSGLEVLVHAILPCLDHAGDHESIADALRAVATPAVRRVRIRHSTGGRTIAGCIEAGGPCPAFT